MPFSCKFQLNNGAIKPEDKVIFKNFINTSFGNFHAQSVKIASVVFNDRDAYISSNCPCFPSSVNKSLTYGTRITEATEIGYFSANGEDIPYDKAYAVITF